MSGRREVSSRTALAAFRRRPPGAVIGRNLDDIVFDRLAGSSGCTEGFFDALADIREQAAI